MAKRGKNWRKLVLPNKKVLIFAAVVLAAAFIYATVWLVHNHAVNANKARFEQANKDVQTVAGQVIAAIGQPADRKDGGKCSYAHQENNTGPITCEVYSYLAYGVGGVGDMNNIVSKVENLKVLHSTPWQFTTTAEKPHEFSNGVVYTDTFVTLHDLLDSETKTNTYYDLKINRQCALNFNYHNSVAQVVGYPSFDTTSSQVAIIYLHCTDIAKAAYFSIQ